MLRAALKEWYALSGGGQVGSAWSRNAHSLGSGIARRNFTTSGSSLLRATPLRSRLVSLPTRSGLQNSSTNIRGSSARPLRRYIHSTPKRRNANRPERDSAGKDGSEPEPQSLSARLKKMSREYGWSALGVYLALSVLDFPFCFLLVRIVGTEKIGQIEHFIVSNAKKAVPQSVSEWWHDYRKALKQAEKENMGNDDISETVEMAGWGVEEAEARNHAEASLGTQLALAYAIHKSFIFIRVPLTAAVLPKVVKVLRSWGYDIGKRSSKKIKVNKP